MAKPTSIVRVSFIDDAPVDPELSPCHAWLRPWLERNPMHRVSNDLAASYAIAILNPPAPPIETGNGYETDPSVPDNVYQWVYGIEMPGGLDVQLITRGVTGNGPQRAATAADPLRAVLEVGLSNGDQCPLVPHGVFVNSLWTSLDPRPLSDLELGKGPDGAQVPWIEFVPPASNSIEAEALGHIVMRMDLLRWSIGLMDDRLPDSRIAPPAGGMFVDMRAEYLPDAWPATLVRSGGTGWTESHTTPVGSNDLRKTGLVSEMANPHAVEILMSPWHIDPELHGAGAAWLADPRGWAEQLWDGSFAGVWYLPIYYESGRRVISHSDWVRQPGVTTTDIQPVWSAIEQPLAWIDLQGYVSMQPTAVGFRLEFIRTRMLMLYAFGDGRRAAWNLSGGEIKTMRGIGLIAWEGGLPHSTGYVREAVDAGPGLGIGGKKWIVDGTLIERQWDRTPYTSISRILIGGYVIENAPFLYEVFSLNGLIALSNDDTVVLCDGKKHFEIQDPNWYPASHHVLATGEVYLFFPERGFYYSPSQGLDEITDQLKAAHEAAGGMDLGWYGFQRFTIFDLETLL